MTSPTRPNHITGRRSVGFRFRLNCRPISRLPLYLPLAMKNNVHIRQILDGVHPCIAFGTGSIESARQYFNCIREKYDFSFWAATEYRIRDFNDPDNIIPLYLNSPQNHTIGIIEERFFNRIPSRYLITKSARRIGLTTCIQAYIIWRQLYSPYSGYAYICGASEFNLLHLRTNLARIMHCEIAPKDKWIRFPDNSNAAFFNPYSNPDSPRGIDFRYVHFADMNKWKDRGGIEGRRAYVAGISGVLPDFWTLIVLEGTRPPFYKRNADFKLLYDEKVKYAIKNPPFFISELLYTRLHRNDSPFLTHIELS